jgi:hypothetical protein
VPSLLFTSQKLVIKVVSRQGALQISSPSDDSEASALSGSSESVHAANLDSEANKKQKRGASNS